MTMPDMIRANISPSWFISQHSLSKTTPFSICHFSFTLISGLTQNHHKLHRNSEIAKGSRNCKGNMMLYGRRELHAVWIKEEKAPCATYSHTKYSKVATAAESIFHISLIIMEFSQPPFCPLFLHVHTMICLSD